MTGKDLFFQAEHIKPKINFEYLSEDMHLKFGSKPIKHKGSLVRRKEHYLIGEHFHGLHILPFPHILWCAHPSQLQAREIMVCLEFSCKLQSWTPFIAS